MLLSICFLNLLTWEPLWPLWWLMKQMAQTIALQSAQYTSRTICPCDSQTFDAESVIKFWPLSCSLISTNLWFWFNLNFLCCLQHSAQYFCLQSTQNVSAALISLPSSLFSSTHASHRALEVADWSETFANCISFSMKKCLGSPGNPSCGILNRSSTDWARHLVSRSFVGFKPSLLDALHAECMNAWQGFRIGVDFGAYTTCSHIVEIILLGYNYHHCLNLS